jgi:hypothetical protein
VDATKPSPHSRNVAVVALLRTTRWTVKHLTGARTELCKIQQQIKEDRTTSVYLIRHGYAGGEGTGSPVGCFRIFWCQDEADAFCKASAQAYSDIYFGYNCGPPREVEPGRYTVVLETFARSFSVCKHTFSKPVSKTATMRAYGVVRSHKNWQRYG